jgi:small neutral amino acid transporter SnatA (MarC family)
MFKINIHKFSGPLTLGMAGILSGFIGFGILIANFCITDCIVDPLLVPLAIFLVFACPAAIVAACYWAAWRSKRRKAYMAAITAAVLLCVAYFLYHQYSQRLMEQRAIECIDNSPVGEINKCP